jgi:hypothetical protein
MGYMVGDKHPECVIGVVKLRSIGIIEGVERRNVVTIQHDTRIELLNEMP